MLLNLKTEMARSKITGADISRALGISARAFSHKLNERTQFSRSEMFYIHTNFFPKSDMKYLFSSTNEDA